MFFKKIRGGCSPLAPPPIYPTASGTCGRPTCLRGCVSRTARLLSRGDGIFIIHYFVQADKMRTNRPGPRRRRYVANAIGSFVRYSMHALRRALVTSRTSVPCAC
jgi:hypothetical protein